MIINIDEKKILTEILEMDHSLHEKIKDRVREDLVYKITNDITSEFINERYNGTKEIWDRILEEVKVKQEEIVKDILKEFYDGYRYGKKDLAILKKLKEILGEN